MKGITFVAAVVLLLAAAAAAWSAATDDFATYRVGLDSPATQAFAITLDDVNTLTNVTRAIYVGSGGDIALTTLGGDSVVLVDTVTGSVIHIRASSVAATNTDASDLVGLY